MWVHQNADGTATIIGIDGNSIQTFDTYEEAANYASILEEEMYDLDPGYRGYEEYIRDMEPADTEDEWWENLTGGEYVTPQEEWQQFRTRFSPGWRRRAPMEDAQQRLQARYMLTRPWMANQVDAAAESGFREPTYADYLSDPGGVSGRVATLAGLRDRANTAATAAGLTGQEFTEQYANPNSAAFNRAAWHRKQLTEEGAQRNIATMLALQRPDIGGKSGGAYGGHMATAIRSAMGDVYQSRLAGGAFPSDFLSWYLKQTGNE